MPRIKKKDHEKLSDSNIEHVISLLEGENPITKKDACEILNIAYNTTRLSRIIEDYKQRKAHIEQQYAQKKGKRATNMEIMTAVEEYLQGENISTIAKGLFRSAGFVKGILDRVGVPQRPTAKDAKTARDYIPEECVSEEFNPGEIVWSAKYHRPAKVIKELGSNGHDHLGKIYRIYIFEAVDDPGPWFTHVTAGGYFAAQPAYDLGKLEHLKQYGVDLEKI